MSDKPDGRRADLRKKRVQAASILVALPLPIASAAEAEAKECGVSVQTVLRDAVAHGLPLAIEANRERRAALEKAQAS